MDAFCPQPRCGSNNRRGYRAIFSDASLVGALRITGLMLSALICFALGAVLTKGE
jgi:hypothetical protein